jgi:hypothetical protein
LCSCFLRRAPAIAMKYHRLKKASFLKTSFYADEKNPEKPERPETSAKYLLLLLYSFPTSKKKVGKVGKVS